MIQSTLEPISTLTSNSATVTFNNDDVRTRSANCCNWLQHNESSPIYKILTGGLYEVSFNANVTSSVVGTIALGLFQDGVLLPGTQMIAQIETTGDYVNVSFDKILKICCRGDATLTIASIPSILTGDEAPGETTITEVPVIQNANFSIIKKA
ncbi:MAG TPA: hypothetical protein IAC14_08760 [Candidatus Scybalomonas excrementigallinarum]|nr:hypothetical protein [Candidatus Scybalomonas excrementigallinarum]